MIEKVRAFVEACSEAALDPGADGSALDADFDRLALEVFARQFEAVPLYRRLCELRGVAPSSVWHWSEIPAAPADLFKEDLRLRAPAAATFYSSGTTAGSERRSRHDLSAKSLALYREASLAHFRAMVLPDSPGPMQIVVLGPTRETHPESSLGHMYSFVVEELAAREEATGEGGTASAPAVSRCFDSAGSLDLDGAIAVLERAATSSTRPLLLLALTTTITALFEELRRRRLELRLPADSRLVDTGGTKGGRTMSRNGILHAAWRFLHIPAYLCVAEYGMTELLSQFYDDAWRNRWSGKLGPRAKVGPRWTRSLLVDPATLAPVAAGERGILRHIDLANVGSIAALQTLDVGYASGAGFELVGRATGAETRGCSQLMSVLTGGQADSDDAS